MAYDWQLRRALTLLSGRRPVRCPYLRRVPRGRSNPAGAACAVRTGLGYPIPTRIEYWELCSGSAHVSCPRYLHSLLASPPTKRATG